MIHQVRASQKDVQLLRQVVSLQLFLLRLATVTISTDFNAGNVENALREIYADEQQARKVGDWIKKKPKLFDALKSFASHANTKEKQNFVDRVEADIQLIYEPRPARLQVALTRNSPDWQMAAKGFLTAFYDIFSSQTGFPSLLFKDRQKGYRRGDFIDGFTDANPELKLCAVCDSTLYRTTINDKPYTSIEHFFPKSRYPHLSVHPYNLIPICPSCNSGAAGVTDPLGDDDRGVLGLILPYQIERPGLTERPGLSEQAYINVKLRSNREKHPLELEMRPSKGHPEAEPLIKNFERVYKVQERWNNDMEWIDQHVFRRITQFLMGDVQSGNRLEDPMFVIDRLKLLLAIISKENLGRDPFGFATIWLIKYHIDVLENTKRSPNDLPLYATLKDWASNQQERWEEYRSHAEEVIKRVP